MKKVTLLLSDFLAVGGKLETLNSKDIYIKLNDNFYDSKSIQFFDKSEQGVVIYKIVINTEYQEDFIVSGDEIYIEVECKILLDPKYL